MKRIGELELGFNDAENYRKRQNKAMFNQVFVRDINLERLMLPNTYFLIGEKGTGKTAYSVYLANNQYANTESWLRYIRETEYQKFVELRRQHHLTLSDYTSIWKVIILLLFAKLLSEAELDELPFSKPKRIRALRKAVDEFYANAFSPEIVHAISFVEDSRAAAELFAKYLNISGEEQQTVSFTESKFQLNLLYIQRKLEDAISPLKLKMSHFLFIDGIDVRPSLIPYRDYLECVKGLANAVWSLNNDYFPTIRDQKGTLKAVMLLRPDIFDSIGFQNQTNKVFDNSVFLDWRTTYTAYQESQLYRLCDRLLSYQHASSLELGSAWNSYFTWRSPPSSHKREHDTPFMDFLRIALSRPRDMVTIMIILQRIMVQMGLGERSEFDQTVFRSHEFRNAYSEYLMGGIKDQIAFYYSEDEYELFLRFFSYLEGHAEFTYDDYTAIHRKFVDYVLDNTRDELPEFIDTPEMFLQFLFDTNIICYIEDGADEPFFRFCYRERNSSNITPKVKPHARYRIHYGLHKKLNIGF